MSNKHLVLATLTLLEDQAEIARKSFAMAFNVIQELDDEDTGDVANPLADLLNAIKADILAKRDKHSGDETPKETPEVTSTHQAQVETEQATVNDAATKLRKVLEALNDERYTLRTVKAVIEFAGLKDIHELQDIVNDNGLDVLNLTRSSDGAALVGLAERN